MPANNSLTLTALDFDTLKQGFLSWMKGQSVFKDYNFTASSTNVLIDILSYNSYLNAFYLNMTFSEMFLDSAQKMDSVVSHAKELNYLPRSAVSSEALVSFVANTVGITNPLTIPKATTFTGKNSNGSYTFTTQQTQTFTSSNSTYTINNLPLYEGTYKQDSFVVNTSNAIPNSCLTFLLTNQNIDLSSLVLKISQDNGSNVQVWTEQDTLFGINGNSTVFFVQAAQNLQYEIIFGDGLFGAVPQNGAVITANYRVTVGPDADGVSNFTCTMDLGAINGGTVNLSTITAANASSGGQLQQSIESVRFTAPRYYATQERAVSSGDYSAIILDEFGGTIEDVTSYGGELLTPKQYGVVVVCLKPTTGTIASDVVKTEILNYLQPRIVVPGRVVITNPDYFYCAVSSTVTYDSSQTGETPTTIQAAVVDAVLDYSNSSLGTFNSSFRYSPFCTSIDECDQSIVSNETDVYLVKRITPVINTASSFTINYNNTFDQVTTDTRETRDQIFPITRLSDEPVVWSSPFTYVDNTSGNSYPLAVIRDDNFGKLIVMTTVNGIVTINNQNIGSVDYATGQVLINDLITTSYGPYISIYSQTAAFDFNVQQEQVLLIDLVDVMVTMQPTIVT